MQESPLLPLIVLYTPAAAPEATINLTVKHGVRSALEYAESADFAKPRTLTNPDVAPHMDFVEMAGRGYAVMTACSDVMNTEFVYIVRPNHARATTPDNGPVQYRVSHRAKMWEPGPRRSWGRRMIEGDAKSLV